MDYPVTEEHIYVDLPSGEGTGPETADYHRSVPESTIERYIPKSPTDTESLSRIPATANFSCTKW
jgi:hypothetical protein